MNDDGRWVVESAVRWCLGAFDFRLFGSGLVIFYFILFYFLVVSDFIIAV